MATVSKSQLASGIGKLEDVVAHQFGLLSETSEQLHDYKELYSAINNLMRTPEGQEVLFPTACAILNQRFGKGWYLYAIRPNGAPMPTAFLDDEARETVRQAIFCD